MPGKVNPVIVESLTMVVARVVGNDATVAFGQTGSFLELNVMLPVTAVDAARVDRAAGGRRARTSASAPSKGSTPPNAGRSSSSRG